MNYNQLNNIRGWYIVEDKTLSRDEERELVKMWRSTPFSIKFKGLHVLRSGIVVDVLPSHVALEEEAQRKKLLDKNIEKLKILAVGDGGIEPHIGGVVFNEWDSVFGKTFERKVFGDPINAISKDEIFKLPFIVSKEDAYIYRAKYSKSREQREFDWAVMEKSLDFLKKN